MIEAETLFSRHSLSG